MIARLIATVLGVGHLRPASGTWGSAAALPLGWVLATLGGAPLLAMGTVAAYLGGIWATGVVTRDMVEKDPSIVVIDEVVGQWIALLPVVIGAAHAGAPLLALWPGWVAAFLLFRLFDIWKPWPVRVFDRMKSPTGVMTDDVVAGIYAALGVMVAAGVAHGLMGA